MVNLRPKNRTSQTETPDLRGMIASEVGETLYHLLPGLFPKMNDEDGEMNDLKIEASLAAMNQQVGGSGQVQNKDIRFKDFSA